MVSPIARLSKAVRPDRTTWIFIALALISGLAVWVTKGDGAFDQALARGLKLVVSIAPILVMAVIISVYARRLMPTQLVERWLGQESGWRGLIIATIGGSITPGGPFTAFPLVVGLYRAGASFEICVAYLSAWTVLGLNRILVWELPFLGPRFTLIRLVVSLPLLPMVWFLAKLVKNRGRTRA